MGAWTSTFMIGITLTSFSLLFRMSSFPQSTYIVVRTGFEPVMPNNGSVHSLPGIEPAPPPDCICYSFNINITFNTNHITQTVINTPNNVLDILSSIVQI
jgi:hypothetical protein